MFSPKLVVAAPRGSPAARPASLSDAPSLNLEDGLATWDWDALSAAPDGLERAVEAMFSHHATLSQHRAPLATFRNFVKGVRDSYRDNPYERPASRRLLRFG